MSTSTEYMDGLNAPAERRFYPRVTPPTPIYVAFGSNNLGVLHNVSENGFQVATPNGLALNSVFRVFLSLNGAAKTIAVTVRTIWTADAEKRSGIQLLDLADEDRAQIRQWVEFEMSRDKNSAAWFLPKNGKPKSGNGVPVEQNPGGQKSAGRSSAGSVAEAFGKPRVARSEALQPATEAPGVTLEPQPVLPVPGPNLVDGVSGAAAASFAAQPAVSAAADACAADANLPPIANPFDDPGPNPQFPAVPLPIHGDFEYAPPESTGRGRRRISSRLRAKPLILWAVALALVCFGANALVRYKISSTSRHYAAESAKYTPPKSDAAAPDSSAPVDDSGANAAAAPAGTQSAANTSNGDNSTSSSATSAPSTTVPTTSAQNDSATTVTTPARRFTARDSETTQPDPRRGSSLDADTSANRAYAATAPPTSEGSEEAARSSQSAPTPRSWSAPAPSRSTSTVSPSDAPQSPSVQSSTNVPTQSTPGPIVSQVRPVPPVTQPTQSSSTNSVVNSAPASNSNTAVNNTPARTQPPSSSQQSSTYAANTNQVPPSRPPSPIYNANTPAQHSAIMSSINQVHSSGIFDSNDSTSASASSAPPAASRSYNSNVATRPVSNASVAAAPVVSSDVPQDRDIEIPAPKGFNASWVELPGEHVVRSAAGTVHVRRMVRVPGERSPGQRWLWRGKMDVTLGDDVNRIDPAVVQASGASGSLTVMASIDKDGYVTDLKPLNGNFALLPAVSRTVRNWHYQPTYLDNKRAETQAQIEFDLRPVPVSASNRAGRP